MLNVTCSIHYISIKFLVYEFKGNKYDKKRLSILNLGEGCLFLLFGYTTINRAIYGDIGMVPFHLMLTIGYGLVFFYSVAEIRKTNKAAKAN